MTSAKLSLIFDFPYTAGYKDVNASVPCDVGSIRNSSFNQLGCCKLPRLSSKFLILVYARDLRFNKFSK